MTELISSLSLLQWGILLVVAIIVGFSKSGVTGVGILMTPLLALVFPAGKSLGILLPLLVFGDIITLIFYRKQVIWPHVWRIIPWSVLGVTLAWLITRYAIDSMGASADAFLKRLIGGVILVVVAGGIYFRRYPEYILKSAGGEIKKTDIDDDPDLVAEEIIVPKTWFTVVIGICTGVASMLTNGGGSALTIYLLALRLRVMTFLGVACWNYLILNAVKLPFNIQLNFIDADSLKLNILLMPVVVIGVLSGIFVAKRISQKLFNTLSEALALAAAVYLLL